ncbi:MAG: hypothetical protein QHH07_10760 [Sedimentisphaerales bacterium]|jgi:hypothetical protein|nr:hypothetical protein [Sedimentisphaerales bacterium]
MMPAWIGLVLLSGSWVFGLGYFHRPNLALYCLMIIAGTPLLMRLPMYRPTPKSSALTLAMAIAAWFLVPWPYRLAVLLLILGLIWHITPMDRRTWVLRLAGASIVVGSVLLVQGLAMWGYEYVAGRSHDLPVPLRYLPLLMARLIGIDAALDGTELAMHTMRQVHRLATTWELLIDPGTWCFLVGTWALGLALPDLKARLQIWATGTIATLLWLPIRTGLMVGLLMHAALRTGYDAPLALMWPFWSGWVGLVMLSGPVALAWMIQTKIGRMDNSQPDQVSLACPWPAILAIVLGVCLLTVSGLYDPPGPRKQGRVLVDEHRSQWERTDRPFDTEWYGHESGYNYACIYDYCSRFFQMGRLEGPIDNNALSDCDVLIIKVPTARYEPKEIAAIKEFVRAGGGLMLVGEHTSVFNTGVYLNDIAKQFGFAFRYDCLFDIDRTYEQPYRPAWVRHPVVQAIPSLDFAVSCSIAPGISPGQAVIRSTGLKNLSADYHASNFYPQVQDHPHMRYGAFIQLWAHRYGKGRVLAFTDSTIFSNFATFEEGKPELMLGMIEWLNHRNGIDLRPWLAIVGLMSGIVGMIKAAGRTWYVTLLVGATVGWGIGGLAAKTLNDIAMDLPSPKRPYTLFVIDRTICKGPLSKSGFIAGPRDGFGIFERWILRLGYFTARRSGNQAFTGDVLVFFYPTGTASDHFRQQLQQYVYRGGKVLILDSPENADSKANGLLYGFGMSVDRALAGGGVLRTPASWPAVQVESAFRVNGGQPIVWLNDQPVAATCRYGRGTMTVIGFGSRFTDMVMGVTGDVIPDQQLRQVFDLEYAILRYVASGPMGFDSMSP